MIAHGAAHFLKERLFDQSDAYRVHVCERCGLIAIANLKKNSFEYKGCTNKTDVVQVIINFLPILQLNIAILYGFDDIFDAGSCSICMQASFSRIDVYGNCSQDAYPRCKSKSGKRPKEEGSLRYHARSILKPLITEYRNWCYILQRGSNQVPKITENFHILSPKTQNGTVIL